MYGVISLLPFFCNNVLLSSYLNRNPEMKKIRAYEIKR